MKKIIITILILLVIGCGIFFGYKYFSSEKTNGKVIITLFYGDTCPHCEALQEYLEGLDDETKSKFELHKYEVWNDFENLVLMKDTAKKYDVECSGVPCFFIGEESYNGYSESMNNQIKTAIETSYKKKIFEDQVEESKTA